MPAVQPQRISATLALISLREKVEETRIAKAAYEQAMAARNQMIQNARRARVRSRAVEQATGLSRDRIARIASRARQSAEKPEGN